MKRGVRSMPRCSRRGPGGRRGPLPVPALAAGHCVEAEEALEHGSGEDGEPSRLGPTFTAALLPSRSRSTVAYGAEVPISIERGLQRTEAAPAGGGRARRRRWRRLRLARTSVWRGDARVPLAAWPTRSTALTRPRCAVRLRQRRAWHVYEDGIPMAIFRRNGSRSPTRRRSMTGSPASSSSGVWAEEEGENGILPSSCLRTHAYAKQDRPPIAPSRSPARAPRSTPPRS